MAQLQMQSSVEELTSKGKENIWTNIKTNALNNYKKFLSVNSLSNSTLQANIEVCIKVVKFSFKVAPKKILF